MLAEDCKRTFEAHDSVGMPKDHITYTRDSAAYQSQSQGLFAAKQECRHKLTDQEVGERPIDIEERDQYLQDSQQSDSYDFTDPDG